MTTIFSYFFFLVFVFSTFLSKTITFQIVKRRQRLRPSNEKIIKTNDMGFLISISKILRHSMRAHNPSLFRTTTINLFSCHPHYPTDYFFVLLFIFEFLFNLQSSTIIIHIFYIVVIIVI